MGTFLEHGPLLTNLKPSNSHYNSLPNFSFPFCVTVKLMMKSGEPEGCLGSVTVLGPNSRPSLRQLSDIAASIETEQLYLVVKSSRMWSCDTCVNHYGNYGWAFQSQWLIMNDFELGLTVHLIFSPGAVAVKKVSVTPSGT
jgi:hypothetical protein